MALIHLVHFELQRELLPQAGLIWMLRYHLFQRGIFLTLFSASFDEILLYLHQRLLFLSFRFR